MHPSPAPPFATFLTDDMVLLRRPHDGNSNTLYWYGQDPPLEEDLWLHLPMPCPVKVAAERAREFAQG